MRFGLGRRSDTDSDSGSMAVVIAVIMVVSLIATTVAFRSVGSAFISNGRQSSASAVSQADAGLADALYRIDQGDTGTGGGSAFCVKPGDPKCIADSVPAAPDVSYLATQLSSTDWLVQSRATVDGQSAAVQDHVTRQPAYPFALFGSSSLQLDGTAPQTFSTYSPAAPAGTTGGQANPDPSGAVTIASNGRVTCSGALTGSVTVEYFAGGGVSSTGTAPCGTYQSSSNRYYLPDVTVPDSPGACPGSGVGSAQFGSGIAGAPTALAPGTYLCTTPLTISGYLSVLGPVQLYIELDTSLYGPGTQALTVAPGSYINDQADYCANGGTTGCGSPQDLPTSQAFEIFVSNPGQIGNQTGGSGFYLGALLYAPGAFLAGDACSSHFYGAVVVSGLTCGTTGGSTAAPLSVSYDSSLGAVYGPWTAGSYSQINPSVLDTAMVAAGL